MAVDDFDERVFATDVGYGVEVASALGGATIAKVEIGGAQGLALSKVLRRVFVSVPTEHKIDVLDPVTLTIMKVLDTGDVAAGWLAMGPGRVLWTVDGPDLVALDLSSDSTTPSQRVWVNPDGNSYGSYLVGGNETGGRAAPLALLSDHASYDDGEPAFGHIDGSNFTFGNYLSRSDEGAAFTRGDFDFTILDRSNMAVRSRENANLNDGLFNLSPTEDLAYANCTEHVAGAYSDDGRWFVGGWQPTIFSVLNAQPYRQPQTVGCMVPNGLKLSHDASREYVIAYNPDGSLTLHVLPGPTSVAAPPRYEWNTPQWQSNATTTWDSGHSRWYAAGGPSDSHVVIYDQNWRPIKVIGLMWGADQVAISPELHRAFVALLGWGGFAEINTDTMRVIGLRRTVSASTANTLGIASGRLWLATPTGWGSVDAINALQAPVVLANPQPTHDPVDKMLGCGYNRQTVLTTAYGEMPEWDEYRVQQTGLVYVGQVSDNYIATNCVDLP